MIYQMKISELFSLLKSFLVIVEQNHKFISREDFEKFPNFSISPHDFIQLIQHASIFLGQNPRYCATTKLYMEKNQEKTNSLISFFSPGELQMRKAYKDIKQGFKLVQQSNIIDQSSYTIYKIAHDYPFNIKNQYIHLTINPETEEASIDLNNITYLIQSLNFPVNFNIGYENQDFIKVFSEYNLLNLEYKIPSVSVVKDTNKTIELFDNTPINLSEFILNSGIVSKYDILENTINTCFYSQIKDVTIENQNKIYKAFKENPTEISVQGFSFIQKKSDLNCKIIVLDDDELLPKLNPSFLYIPVKNDLKVVSLYQDYANLSDELKYNNIIVSLLDNFNYWENMFFSSVMNMMLEQNSIFISTNIEEIMKHPIFFNGIENPDERKRLKANILFIINILLSDDYKYNSAHQNICSELIRLLKSLNYSIKNTESMDLGFYTPLNGKDNLYNSKKENFFNIYNNYFEYQNDQRVNSKQFSDIITSDMKNYIEENFFKKSEKFALFYLLFKSNPLFQLSLDSFFKNHYPNKTNNEIINGLINGDNIHLRKFSIYYIINNQQYSWIENYLPLEIYVEAFYNSNIDENYIQKNVNTFHKEITIDSIFRSKEKFKNFELILTNIIRYRGISPTEQYLYNDLSIDFFMKIMKNENINISHNLILSDEKLINILYHENKDDVTFFIEKMSKNYINIKTDLFTLEIILLINNLYPEISHNLANNIVRMSNSKFHTQEFFDLFMKLSPKSVIHIIKEYPIHILSLPKNIKKILHAVIENKYNASELYLRISPELYYHYSHTKKDLNSLNQGIYNTLEKKALSLSIPVNHVNLKVLKF